MKSSQPTLVMQDAVRVLLKSKKFLAWRPGRIFFKTGDRLRPEETKNRNQVGEKHFTPAELAEAWGVDVETIRNIFRDEPGVLKISNASKLRTTLRIPQDVAERVHRRLAA